MIEIKYKWPCPEDDADAITGITLNQEHVPRVGDSVSIRVVCDGEQVDKYSKVEHVFWKVTEDKQMVIVRLVR